MRYELSDFRITVRRPDGKTYEITPDPVIDKRCILMSYKVEDGKEIMVIGCDDIENPDEADDYMDTIIRIETSEEGSMTCVLMKGHYDKEVYYKGERIASYYGVPVREGYNTSEYICRRGVP